MSKALTPDLILARAKTDNLYSVKKINLWGNDIEDVKLLRQMPNVEVLSLSVNKISSLKEFGGCPKLQELYLRKNNIADLSEIRYLINLQDLKILWLWDNPCSEHPKYREYIIKMLPNLTKLDNEPITPEEKVAASKLNINFGDYHISPKGKEAPYSSNNQVLENEGNNNNKYSNDYQTPKNYAYKNEGEPQFSKEEGARRGNASEQSTKDRQQQQQYGGGKDYGKEYQSDNQRYGSAPSDFKNENIICAIASLLKELDEKGLEFVKNDVEKKLSTLRLKGKNE